MSMKERIIQAQNSLEAFMKKRRFAKANRARELSIEERCLYTDCYGKLNESLANFTYTIQAQVNHIRVGKAEHRSTVVQEGQLWDAAIGYMLVKDAMYAMDSLYDQHSLNYAYDLLNGAVSFMNGKKPKTSRFTGIRMMLKKNQVGHLSSEEAISEKEALLETFFEELKRTGNIDECIRNAHNAAEQAGQRRFSPEGTDNMGGGGNPLRTATVSDPAVEEEFGMFDRVHKMGFRAPQKEEFFEEKTSAEPQEESELEEIPLFEGNPLREQLTDMDLQEEETKTAQREKMGQ